MTEGTGQQRHGILLGNGAARDVRGRMVAHVSTNAGCTQGATPHPGAATAASGHNTHMDIILNGQSLPLPDQTTLAALLEAQHLAQRRVAVEINGEIIPRSLHAEHVLAAGDRSEEHTSELQSLMRISYAVFCLKKKNAENI